MRARPCDVSWIRSIKDQCAAAGVACFVKQLGANVPCDTCGKRATCVGAYEMADVETPQCDECCGHGNEDGKCWPIGNDKKGGDMAEWSADLRVREMPR